MSYGKEPTDSNLEKAVYPHFVLQNITLSNGLVKVIAVKIIMSVHLSVTPCASRLTPPVLKMETEYYCESVCAPANKM